MFIIVNWRLYWRLDGILLTKLSTSCLKVYHLISLGVGTKLGPLDKRDLQASEHSVSVRLMAYWSGPFNWPVEVVTFLLSNQSFFLYLSCHFLLDFLNLLFLHLHFKVLMWSLSYFLWWHFLISCDSLFNLFVTKCEIRFLCSGVFFHCSY